MAWACWLTPDAADLLTGLGKNPGRDIRAFFLQWASAEPPWQVSSIPRKGPCIHSDSCTRFVTKPSVLPPRRPEQSRFPRSGGQAWNLYFGAEN